MTFFCDSNVLVYAFSDDMKRAQAMHLLGSGPDISVQVLNEFVNVSRKKLRNDWVAIHGALSIVHLNVNAIHPITLKTHDSGLLLAERYKFQTHDAMIVSAALIARCDTLYSEDMQDGMVIENRLIIRNPFA
jgi:predicted nucleic acid-binding protein